MFTAEVRIGGAVFSGQGTTRKDAEQEAAKLMLEYLKNPKTKL
ncbi:MAG: hypothetical protein LBE49_01015 [Deltaproteobacteria bacterium]|nr:hypothetical protein [Deltaproteobacteria bacterium]